jgi:DNA-binding transcriptional LysR family regulator
MLDLRRLRYFTAVADELHFGRAAARLHIAQPPLSQQIRRLETELGVELFRRNRRRVELTGAGRLLLENGRPLLQEADRVEALLLRAGRGEAGRLRIGFVGSASYETLPAILRAFRESRPEVELTLREMTTPDQLGALGTGRLDVGLIRPPVTDAGPVDLVPLVLERIIAVLPDTHPLAARERVAVADLADEPFVFFPRRIGVTLYDDVLAVCREAGFTPRIVQEAEETHTVISLVSAGIGVSLLPEAVETIRRPHVVFRPLDGPNTELELSLAKRAGDSSPLVQQFVETAQAVVG